MNTKRVLIVDDDMSLLRVMEHHLCEAGYTVSTAANGEQGLQEHRSAPAAVIFTDLKMDGMDGITFIREIRKFDPHVSIIVITGFPTIDSAVAAMKAGALDFIQKPVEKERLLAVTGKALSFFNLQDENARLRTLVSEHLDFGAMIGQSPAIRNVYALAKNVADSSVTLLITGETGTGKEMLARAIHTHGKRKDCTFVAVNCAAIPSQLLESELFGHVKGAFTGAVSDRPGLIEEADGGTLFLDEIGDLPLEIQPKLLRMLQQREYQIVGSNKTSTTDARFVVATHRDLKAMVEQKLFREDLYYRLNVLPLVIPPVRERIEDIAPLFLYFLREAADEENKPVPEIDHKVYTLLERYPWPGNVREIRNLAQRLMVFHTGTTIYPQELPDMFAKEQDQHSGVFDLPEEGLDLDEWTDRIILKALQKNQWNQSKTAAFLHISRNTLIYRMNKNNLKFRNPGAE